MQDARHIARIRPTVQVPGLDVRVEWVGIADLDARPIGPVRNSCPCTHCDGFRAAPHARWCGGYHCKGTCMWIETAKS